MESAGLDSLVWPLVRSGIGILLLVAGVAKLAVLPEFVKEIEALRLASEHVSRYTARSIPIIEGILGGMLVANIYAEVAAYFAIGLFAMFAIVVGSALRRSRSSGACRCFGRRSSLDWSVVLRNVGLAVCATGICIPSRAFALTIIGVVIIGGGALGAQYSALLIRRTEITRA